MQQLSRSEQKRQHKQIEAAAREICALRDPDLARLDLTGEITAVVRQCRTLKGGALKRQVKYLARLLSLEPIDETLQRLASLKGSKLEENRRHRQAELLRDAIIDEVLAARERCRRDNQALEMDWPSEALAEVLALYPGIDEAELRRTAHRYAGSRNAAQSRELFRILRAAVNKARYQGAGD